MAKRIYTVTHINYIDGRIEDILPFQFAYSSRSKAEAAIMDEIRSIHEYIMEEGTPLEESAIGRDGDKISYFVDDGDGDEFLIQEATLDEA